MPHTPERAGSAARVMPAILASVIAGIGTGCLAERSFEMEATDYQRVAARTTTRTAALTTRQWLLRTHEQLASLLPPAPSALLTENLLDENGKPTDVFAHFGMRQESLQSILDNFRGIRCTAQAAARGYCIDEPAPPWSGFEDVWIPVLDDLSLSGRLGYAMVDGRPKDADCIVLMPGLYGDNGVRRTRDLAIFLRDSGFHVLALEPRGHGQTEARYPKKYCTFGVGESDDLMAVSDWLEDLPHVQRTGLVGYCWSSNVALLAAWYDGREKNDPCIHPAIQPELMHYDPNRRRFRAGIIAFSPVLGWEVLMDELDQPRSAFAYPIFAAIQQTVRDRMIRKNFPEKSGNLRKLIRFEIEGTGVPLPDGAIDGYSFIRLIPYKGEPDCDKLESARLPVLIVHGCDDPLAPAQDVATLIAETQNPEVAAIVLPGGGHVGFAAYAKRYYFSLVANFFDPTRGAAAVQ